MRPTPYELLSKVENHPECKSALRMILHLCVKQLFGSNTKHRAASRTVSTSRDLAQGSLYLLSDISLNQIISSERASQFMRLLRPKMSSME